MNIAARAQVALGDFMLSRGGSTDPSRQPNAPFVLYSIPAFDIGQPEFVRGNDIGSPKKNVESGDVLLSRIVPHIRRSWIVGEHPGRKILASGEWIVFRSDKIHAPYLRHFLVSDIFHQQFMQTVSGVGGSLLRASPNYVSKITIPLPALDEQQRIAAVLDKADAVRSKRKRAIDLVDGFAESVFLEMFGDPAKECGHFGKKQLVACCTSSDDIRCGPFGTQLYQSDFQSSGVPLWGIKHVNTQFNFPTVEFLSPAKAEQLRNYDLLPGDLVMTRKGTIGNVAVYPPAANGIMHSDFVAGQIRQGSHCSRIYGGAAQIRSSHQTPDFAY